MVAHQRTLLAQVREHELDEEKAEADVNNSNALAGELAERKRTLEQWSVAAYGEVRARYLPALSTPAVVHFEFSRDLLEVSRTPEMRSYLSRALVLRRLRPDPCCITSNRCFLNST